MVVVLRIGLEIFCDRPKNLVIGLIGLIESLAVELSPDRVTANCVCPGSCPTTGMGRSLTAWKAA